MNADDEGGRLAYRNGVNTAWRLRSLQKRTRIRAVPRSPLYPRTFPASHSVVSRLLHGVEVKFGGFVLGSTSAGYGKSSQTILHLWDAPPRVDVDRFRVLVVVYRRSDRRIGKWERAWRTI